MARPRGGVRSFFSALAVSEINHIPSTNAAAKSLCRVKIYQYIFSASIAMADALLRGRGAITARATSHDYNTPERPASARWLANNRYCKHQCSLGLKSGSCVQDIDLETACAARGREMGARLRATGNAQRSKWWPMRRRARLFFWLGEYTYSPAVNAP